MDSRNFSYTLVALVITTAFAGSSSSSGGTVSPSESNSRSSGTTTVLFSQPQVSEIAAHFFVPLAVHEAPPKGTFEMVLWQPNPNSSNGLLVPTAWDAGSVTGFTPASSLPTTQLGFQNQTGTSTAQMDSDSVGAYVNSTDLPGSPAGQKMMITPQFSFAPGSEPVPFASSGSTLNSSMYLQIPIASGRKTYVVADYLFKGPNGVRLSFGVKIFSNGGHHPVMGTGYDVPSNTYMLNSPLLPNQRYVTVTTGSATATGTPWLGWQQFSWSVSEAQFVAGLQFLATQYPGTVETVDPTQYVLEEVHLNAELHFNPNPAELGWSMRGWQVWTSGT